jgi:hypothetical protein
MRGNRSSMRLIENSLTKYFSIFFLFLTAATIFRNGFSLYGLRWRQFQSANDNFVCEYRSCGQLFIGHSIEKFGHNFGAYYFFIFYTLFVLFCALVIFRQVFTLTHHNRLKASVLITFLPASAIILQRFGTYDAIPLLMSIIGVLAKSKVGALLAAILLIGVNPEAGLVSGMGLVLLYVVASCQPNSLLNLPKNSFFFGIFQIVMSTPLLFLSLFDKTEGSALEAILFVDSLNALAQLIASGPLLLFSWFGSLWFVIIKILHSVAKEFRFRIYLVIIFIGSTTLIASDGTRNSALGLTAIAVSIIFSSQGQKQISILSRHNLLALYAIPVINIANFNLVLPFYQVLYILDIARPILVTN